MFTYLFSGLVLHIYGTYAISDEARKLVTDWAPIIWIHPDEPFYPSSVQFHLNNVQVNDGNDQTLQDNPDKESILTGSATESYHLNTRENISCVHCYLPFFSGETLDKAPVYTFVTEHLDDCSTVDVTYLFFYPYNYGKDVCVGLEEFGVCIGEWRTFGNHVGDWEHVSLRFQNGEPVQIYVDTHSFGAWYNWNRNAGRFEFSDGKPLKKVIRKDNESVVTLVEIDYPKYLELENSRPAIFSANGSHGTWAQPGKHTYLHILTFHLDDVCEKGYKWKSWENLEIHETGDLDSFTGENSWINFRGRWGNTHKLECELDPYVGECGLVEGPFGPDKHFQHDFQQPPVCN